MAEQPADDEQKQRDDDQAKQGQQRIHGQHDDKYRDDLYDIDQEIRQAVYKKPIYRGRVVVDLRHEAARLPPGKETERQTLYGIEYRALHVVYQFSCNAGSNNGSKHIDQRAADIHGCDEQYQKQDLPVETAVPVQYLVIEEF